MSEHFHYADQGEQGDNIRLALCPDNHIVVIIRQEEKAVADVHMPLSVALSVYRALGEMIEEVRQLEPLKKGGLDG